MKSYRICRYARLRRFGDERRPFAMCNKTDPISLHMTSLDLDLDILLEKMNVNVIHTSHEPQNIFTHKYHLSQRSGPISSYETIANHETSSYFLPPLVPRPYGCASGFYFHPHARLNLCLLQFPLPRPLLIQSQAPALNSHLKVQMKRSPNQHQARVSVAPTSNLPFQTTRIFVSSTRNHNPIHWLA